MDSVRQEKIRRALVKLEIALGVSESRGSGCNFQQAFGILKDLQREIDTNDSVALLNISGKIIDRLERAGIERISQVRSMSDAELLALPGFGSRFVHELRAALV
jgi:DNA-directed RNA polymerase alpha subunit